MEVGANRTRDAAPAVASHARLRLAIDGSLLERGAVPRQVVSGVGVEAVEPWRATKFERQKLISRCIVGRGVDAN